MLLHAPWVGRDVFDGAHVLDAFAGTGALGLEALSRGAAHVTFMEQDRSALAALRTNIAACSAERVCTVLAGDALNSLSGGPCGVVFLDPPYGLRLVSKALNALAARGWIAASTLIVAETAGNELADARMPLLTERRYGAARISVWRAIEDVQRTP